MRALTECAGRKKPRSLGNTSAKWHTKSTAACLRSNTSSSCQRQCRSWQSSHRCNPPESQPKSGRLATRWPSPYPWLQDRVEDLRGIYKGFGVEAASRVKVRVSTDLQLFSGSHAETRLHSARRNTRRLPTTMLRPLSTTLETNGRSSDFQLNSWSLFILG